jgi:transcriptional regulator with XRE-family HTH domain
MTRNWAELFGEQLARLRKAKNLKQHELEERIGTSQQYVSHLETAFSSPAFDMLPKIADALDVPVMELFFVEGLNNDEAVLRGRIENLLARCDEKQLRKFYRLLLVCLGDP